MKTSTTYRVLFFIMLQGIISGFAYAGIEVAQFATPEQEQTYKVLTNELRCLVCQNQNIADSNAPLAKDLRVEIRKMIRQGKNKQQIIDFMVARYGDFVLYRPPFRPYTLVLWLGPFVGLVLALYILIRLIRKRSTASVDEISAADQARIAALLTTPTGKNTEN